MASHSVSVCGADDPVRLDGWKSIAAHFNRDRATVIRWAQTRELPVHRLPGGKTGTVYALSDELDRWAGIDLARGMATPPVVPEPVRPTRSRRRHIAGGAAALLGICIATAVFFGMPNQQSSQAAPAPAASARLGTALPADPAVARKFLTARDLTADREALGLERAIGLLEEVTVAAPDFAPGYTSLAEAYLLSREFGMRADRLAFARARQAARAAVRLAPELASGHRMLGFVAYWADGNFGSAEAAFRKALALAPDDALSHFWFGNILSEHGHVAAAMRELNRAQLLMPGSAAIQTDIAWARWAAGDEQGAVAALETVVDRHPDFAVAHDCLASIMLARGDLKQYMVHFERFADLRRDAELRRRVAALRAAGQRGRVAIQAELTVQAEAQMMAEVNAPHILPALMASIAGDRAQMLRVLLRADGRNERWNNVGLTRRIATLWQADQEITRLIEQRRNDRNPPGSS